MNPQPAPLPTLTTSLTPGQIVERVRELSKRGKIDAFEPTLAGSRDSTSPAPLFSACVGGAPFESRLLAFAEPASPSAAAQTSGVTLRFERRLERKLPIIFAIAILATIWPGVHLMDMFIADWAPSLYPYTWYWYLPLAILAAPLAWWPAMRRSRTTGTAGARELIDLFKIELAASSPSNEPRL